MPSGRSTACRPVMTKERLLLGSIRLGRFRFACGVFLLLRCLFLLSRGGIVDKQLFQRLSSSASSALLIFEASKVRSGSAPPPFITGSLPFHFSRRPVLEHCRRKRPPKYDIGLRRPWP